MIMKTAMIEVMITITISILCTAFHFFPLCLPLASEEQMAGFCQFLNSVSKKH